jgi:hypothetical protein
MVAINPDIPEAIALRKWSVLCQMFLCLCYCTLQSAPAQGVDYYVVGSIERVLWRILEEAEVSNIVGWQAFRKWGGSIADTCRC